MWTRSHSITTNNVTSAQLWGLFSDVNAWPTWDEGLEYTHLEGQFTAGNSFKLRPKGGPILQVELIDTVKNQCFTDMTKFFLARLYDEHTFEQTPEGMRVTNTLTVRGPLAWLWVWLVVRNMAATLPADMARQLVAAQHY